MASKKSKKHKVKSKVLYDFKDIRFSLLEKIKKKDSEKKDEIEEKSSENEPQRTNVNSSFSEERQANFVAPILESKKSNNEKKSTEPLEVSAESTPKIISESPNSDIRYVSGKTKYGSSYSSSTNYQKDIPAGYEHSKEFNPRETLSIFENRRVFSPIKFEDRGTGRQISSFERGELEEFSRIQEQYKIQREKEKSETPFKRNEDT